MRRAAISLAASAAIAWQPALAETQFPAMGVIVTISARDNSPCGVDQQSVEGALRAALRYNRVDTRDLDLFAPSVSVDIVAINLTGQACAINVSVHVSQLVTLQEEKLGKLFAQADLCRQSQLLTGIEQPRRVNDSVRDLLDQCLTVITKSRVDS